MYDDKPYINDDITGMYNDMTDMYNDMTEYVRLIIHACTMINHT